jgi:hypothetical protein
MILTNEGAVGCKIEIRGNEQVEQISETDLRQRIAKDGLMLESWSDGAIRLNLSPCSAPRDIDIDAIPQVAAPVFITAYRESRPGDRYAVLDSRRELVSFIANSLALASSVDDDVYIIPLSGEFMLYVSHHDTLTIWEKPD